MTDTDRLAALEKRVAALEARLDPPTVPAPLALPAPKRRPKTNHTPTRREAWQSWIEKASEAQLRREIRDAQRAIETRRDFDDEDRRLARELIGWIEEELRKRGALEEQANA